MPPDRVLPAWLVEHAERFSATGGAPVAPRRAATVVLLRDGAAGVQAYTVRRAATMAFAAGMHAFPGGSVDPRDAEVALDWVGPTPAEWAARLGLDGDVAAARGVVSATVRELFEETGVLLAGAGADGAVVGDVSGDDWEADRRALARHEVGLAELLAARGLRLRGDLLRPWARWITPEFEPRRYDTFFFLAALPDGQVTRDVGGEADRTDWLRPADAVAEHAAGRMAMLPPTAVTLAGLAELAAGGDRVGALLSADRPGGAIVPVTPRVVLGGPVARLVLPGEPGYGPDPENSAP